MRDHLGGFRGPLAAERFEGGQSNPTYKLLAGTGAYVLRRKPLGHLCRAPMRSTGNTGSCARWHAQRSGTRVYALCEDDTVIGSVFYLMEFLDGRIFWDQRLPGLASTDRQAMFDSMNAVIAALHSVDHIAVGLAEFGRPGNYLVRQVGRWSKDQASETEPQPAMDALIEWLPRHLPPEGEPRIVAEGNGAPGLIGIHRLNALSKLIQTWARAHKVSLDNPVKPGVRPAKPDGRDRRLIASVPSISA